MMGDAISGRELEVLRLLVTGRTNREIAAELVVSHRTVQSHVAALMRKTRTERRVQLAVHAVLTGLVCGESP
jgi:DNA-binding NarL/FixJ family response regulator